MTAAHLVPIFVALLGVPLGFLGFYFQNLGTIAAQKSERKFLQQQLAENTQITQSIENRLSDQQFLGRHELDFRERQLSEFYGPVYGYLKSQRTIFEMWDKDKLLNSINWDVKKLFAKQNAKMRELIVTKAHLIDSTEMPPSFVAFCTATLIFDLMAAKTEAGTVPAQVANDIRAKYPQAFLDHIFATTEALKKRVDDLHKQYAIPLPKTEIKNEADAPVAGEREETRLTPRGDGPSEASGDTADQGRPDNGSQRS